jgi:hypothetical protein
MSIATTASGKFDLLNPSPKDIDWLVVASGLGKICRFAGNTMHHYSVAEHSVRLADVIAKAGGDRDEQLREREPAQPATAAVGRENGHRNHRNTPRKRGEEST